MSSVLYYLDNENSNIYPSLHQDEGYDLTYGRLTFVADLIKFLSQNLSVDFWVANMDKYPLYSCVPSSVQILDVAPLLDIQSYDLVLIDSIDDFWVDQITDHSNIVSVIHLPSASYSSKYLDSCRAFLVMSRNSYQFFTKKYPHKKVFMIHQGVDFSFFKEYEGYKKRQLKRILISSRVEGIKEKTIIEVVTALKNVSHLYDVTILGKGEGVKKLQDLFPFDFTFVSYVPYISMPRFVQNYDLVISSGRGVLEALSMGIPAIVAGYGYGGLVCSESMASLSDYNFAASPGGVFQSVCSDILLKDIEKGLDFSFQVNCPESFVAEQQVQSIMEQLFI